MPGAVIRIDGLPQLQQALKELTGREFGTAMRGMVKKSATRMKRHIHTAIKGDFFSEPTGNLRDAFKKVKSTAKSNRRSGVHRALLPMPTRIALGIPRPHKANDAQWYYPAIVEYGHPKAGPKPWIRSTVNKNVKTEAVKMGRDVAKAVERVWRRRMKKAVAIG